ncbi:MAG: GNAT family N-acetyltransferase [Alphaproteobacteria bacterium]
MDTISQPLITLERVPALSSPLFRPCAEVLRNSIPSNEQLSDQRLTHLLGRDDYRMYALLLNGTVVATAILYLPRAEDFVLLDYMAVRAELRNRGLGSALFREVTKTASQERPAASFLFFEVDDDRGGRDAARSINRRRIEFYRRLGAKLLVNAEYVFPSSSGAGVPMRLMVFRLRPEIELSQELVGTAVENIFREVHGRDKDDALLRSIVDHLPSRLILE